MEPVDLFFGPYLGDFKQEIMTFRPYITWLSEQLNPRKRYISTHFNRGFLYGFPNIEINREISLDEHNQKNFIHKSIDKTTYTSLQKEIKEQILQLENTSRKHLKNYSLSYVQFNQPYSIYQKTFEKIKFIDNDLYTEDISDYVVFIADEIGNYQQSEYLIDHISKRYKILIIGDRKVHFSDSNELLKKSDYEENAYKYLLRYIDNCRCVVCPSGHWTFLSNLQGVPVFSWGEGISLYKLGGDYHFNNKNMIFYADERTKKETIFNQFDWFYQRLRE